MRILVTGARDWDDVGEIYTQLFPYMCVGNVLVHGGCPTGADAIANKIWREKGLAVEVYPAEWKMYGRAAGPIRNKLMVDSKPDLVLAFRFVESRGTKNCVMLARKANLRVIELVREWVDE